MSSFGVGDAGFLSCSFQLAVQASSSSCCFLTTSSVVRPTFTGADAQTGAGVGSFECAGVGLFEGTGVGAGAAGA